MKAAIIRVLLVAEGHRQGITVSPKKGRGDRYPHRPLSYGAALKTVLVTCTASMAPIGTTPCVQAYTCPQPGLVDR